MKTRLIFAALLLLTFGTARAQDTLTVVKRGADAKKVDTLRVITPNMSELPELMQELGVYLQMLNDSVDWKNFEKDMEKWGTEMEEWGGKMERWGEEFEKKNDKSYKQRPLEKDEPQVRGIQVEGSGDVKITQNPDLFSLVRVDQRNAYYEVVNNTLILRGSSDYEVAMPQLDEVILRSSGDVQGKGIIKGGNLKIFVAGSGDLWMNVDYDTINIQMRGSGDVTLHGQCKVLYAEMTGSGDLKVQQLDAGEFYINATGSGSAWTSKSGNVLSYEYRKSYNKTYNGLLFDAHWNGFQTGLNMLFGMPIDGMNPNNGAQGLELRPLRSWYFGFNIADVGIAFNKRHTVGVFTGVGIGWNNFSWNNKVTVEYDPDQKVYKQVPIDTEQIVKNTKHGVLYLEMPLMIEVRPTRRMYIEAGVTGGLRIAQWNRVKLADGTQNKHYYSSPINRFKLDASLRVGTNDIGFFASYGLLPVFNMTNAKVHPLSFGFSINF